MVYHNNNYLIDFSIVDYFLLQEKNAFFGLFDKLKEFKDDNVEMRYEVKSNILKTLNKDKDVKLNDTITLPSLLNYIPKLYIYDK